jgi:hypothetical protein
MGLLDMLLNQGSPLSIANGGPVPINPLATPQSILHGAGGTQAGYSTTGAGGTQLIIDFNSYVDGVNNSLPQPSQLDIENGVINTPQYNFTQTYLPGNQYTNVVGEAAPPTSPLVNTFDNTDLDLENGGPINDLVTQYSSPWLSGTPTNTANPGPLTNFTQNYVPANQYASNITLTNSPLAETLSKTNLDIENSSVDGGPNVDIITNYPSTVTGTPTLTANPGGPLTNFSQPYIPTNQYISNVSLNSSPLAGTLPITNLDVENLGVQGGPNNDIITVYPPTSTGTPGSGSHFWTYAGGTYPGASRFIQSYTPNNPYGVNVLNSNLANTLKITNYDIENSGSDGGIPYKTERDATVYPITTNGSTPNRGYFSTPGKPSSKYGTNNVFLPSNTYMNYIQSFI